MTQKSKRRRRQNNNAQGIVIGVGIILVGIALFLLWSGFNSASNASPTAGEASVEPMAVNFPAPQLAL